MDLDADPQSPERDHPRAASPSVPDGALSWLRTPLTMRQLCGLGIVVVGGGIPAAVLAGGWAWLGLGVMVIIIIAMAMAHEGRGARRRGRIRTRALRRTRGRRGSAGSAERGARRTGTRRGGEAGPGALRPKGDAGLPRPGDEGVPPRLPHARKGEPARAEVPPEKTRKKDRR
jgi:hypothetical protein